MNRHLVALSAVLAVTMAGVACAQPKESGRQQYADVVAVNVQARGENRFDFDVTVSSPYETAERYADAFRVMSADGRSYGERKLLHDHAGEQPFTRDLHGVSVPTGIRTVVVQARDLKFGYGGKTMQVALPGR